MYQHLFIILVVAFTSTAAGQTGTWMTYKHMPTSRQEMPCAFLNGKLYVAGGIIIASTNKMEVYDPGSDSWSLAAPMPDSRHHHMMAVANEQVFAIGGFKSVISFDAQDRVWAYDPEANAWTEKSPLPEPVGAGAAVELNGKIYVLGGTNGTGVLDAVYVYDPVFDTWSSLEPMPTPREHLGAAVIGSKIYAVGGRGTFDAGVVLEAYDPALDTWEQLAAMPTERSGLAAASLDNKLYVIGGEGGGIHAENEEYDPELDSWRSVAPLPTPRHGFTACVIQGEIYTPGGGMLEGYGPSNVLEAFSPDIISAENHSMGVEKVSWTALPGSHTLTLHFSLAKSELIRISLVDPLGRTIDDIRAMQYQAGSHTAVLNTEKLTSGIYFFKIESSRESLTGTILLP